MTSGGSEFPEAATESDGVTADTDPTDVFDVLGDETRLRILLALYEPSTGTPLEFSQLYDEIEVEFTSGFNYHLDKLTPEYVTKVGTGYELTSFGRSVALTIAAGTFADNREIDWFPVDGECVVCDERSLHARYEEFEMFTLECQSCEEGIINVRAPPNLVKNCSDDELADAIDQYMYNWLQMSIRLARHGICKYCGSAVESSVFEANNSDRLDITLRFDCNDCGENTRCPVGMFAYQHPDVKLFHHQRDTYLRDRLHWEIEQWITDDHMEIVSTDPWEFEVSFYADGDTCTVTVTGEPEVVDVTIG